MGARSTELSAEERLDWLRLIRTENVRPITHRGLMARFPSAAEALSALPELSRAGGRATPLRPFPRAAALKEVERLQGMGGRLIAAVEPDYPAPLASLEDAPPVIAVLGHAHLLARPAVAIVGARNASLNGKGLARQLAEDLGRAGWVVVSGLARGIDAAAHDGALATGTVAVMAGGVDVCYPPENEALYRRILAEGAAVAESPLGMQPQARHFPRRNRLVSGLSLGVVVVEAAPRSGSLITARLAAEQGREVFAVPGSPLDPRSQGTNQLIRGGATLVQNAADVLEGLAAMADPRPLAEREGDLFDLAPAPEADRAALARARALIAESLSPSPTAVDELVRHCQLSAALVLTVLLELELAGRLERHPGNRVSMV
jgi:DNA processing protein